MISIKPMTGEHLGLDSSRISLLGKSPVHRKGIMVVDDHELVRLGLRALVQSQARASNTPLQIFEVRTVSSALEMYSLNRADISIVFLDLGLPDAEGLSGLSRFRHEFPAADVVVLSGDANPSTVEGALALGASGYITKTGDLSEVIKHIRSRGLLGEESASGSGSERGSSVPSVPGLTARQSQILGWVLEGKSNREISRLAFLAEGTVKNHVSTILLNFGVRSRAQLISSMR
jgi:DNA-binding NarL/FixJ family response regulator